MRVLTIGFAAASLALAGGACRLPAEAPAGSPSNVVVRGRFAYATLGEEGIGVFRMPEGVLVRRLAPTAGAESFDDLALSEGLLFALDARTPGYLAVFVLEEEDAPTRAGPPVRVPVGPFSGVSAARGRAIVSGGTSELTVWRYDERGALMSDPGTLDLGRGQPDVLLAPDGAHAYVSTHFSLLADTFGLTTVGIGQGSSRSLATLEIDGAGFSPGGSRPANFPLEMALSGDLLLMACGAGVVVADVHDPAQPVLAGTIDIGLAGVNVDARGNDVVIVGSSPQPTLVWLEAREGRAPVVRSRVALPPGSRPTGVALGDGLAVVAAQEAGLVVVMRP